MISRRGAVLGLLAATPALASPMADDEALMRAANVSFRVLRNDKNIGTHSISSNHVSGGFDVHIAVDIAYSIGPITLYRYSLRGVEQWRGGKFERLDAQTNDDGTRNFATITREASGLRVSGSANAGYLAPDSALPGTHWNRNELAGPWISPQDGKLLNNQVTDGGSEQLAGPDGAPMRAERFIVSGDVHLEIWYDADRRWARLRAPAVDGSVIVYEQI